jgi:hypothetical protein
MPIPGLRPASWAFSALHGAPAWRDVVLMVPRVYRLRADFANRQRVAVPGRCRAQLASSQGRCSSRHPCHNGVVHAILAAAKATETFNGDYYLAIVTVLPILMVAVEVLTNFNKSIPVQLVKKWPLPFQFGLTFFYLFSPIIAAAGIIIGVLALIYRDTNAVFQWLTFSCLVGVLGFLALSSTVYLLVFDTAQTARERAETETKSPPDPDGAAH